MRTPALEKPESVTARVRKRREKNEMIDEKAELFARVLDLKKAGVHQRHLFDFSFRTDGVGAFVCAVVLMRKHRDMRRESKRSKESADGASYQRAGFGRKSSFARPRRI